MPYLKWHTVLQHLVRTSVQLYGKLVSHESFVLTSDRSFFSGIIFFFISDKTQVRLTMKKREKAQITKISNKGGEILQK